MEMPERLSNLQGLAEYALVLSEIAGEAQRAGCAK